MSLTQEQCSFVESKLLSTSWRFTDEPWRYLSILTIVKLVGMPGTQGLSRDELVDLTQEVIEKFGSRDELGRPASFSRFDIDNALDRVFDVEPSAYEAMRRQENAEREERHARGEYRTGEVYYEDGIPFIME